jgi:hypothetical protein
MTNGARSGGDGSLRLCSLVPHDPFPRRAMDDA